MNRIYLSSSMASCKDTYRDKFKKVQEHFEKDGYIVVNPATLPDGLDGTRYMPICFTMIDSVDAIYLFGDWQNSKGACLEKAYAEYQGKTVLYEVKDV